MNIIIINEKSGIFLYSPESLTKLRRILIQKPMFMDVGNRIEYEASSPFKDFK
jgi:hypothetical protein